MIIYNNIITCNNETSFVKDILVRNDYFLKLYCKIKTYIKEVRGNFMLNCDDCEKQNFWVTS